MPDLKIVGEDGRSRRPSTSRARPARPWLAGPPPSLEEFVGRVARNLPRATTPEGRNEIHAALSGIIHHHGKAVAYGVMDRLGLRDHGFKRYGFDEP